MKYTGLGYSIYHWFASIPPKLKFKTRDPLTPDEKKQLIEMLAKDYYIILTGNNYYASSIAVKLFTRIKTGKWTKYSHVFMNCDYVDSPEDVFDFKFMEATSKGVHYSRFDEVFDCETICLLSPKNMSKTEWTKVIDKLVENNGKPYDDLFQLADDSRLSCVELVRNALKGDGQYDQNFSNLEYMIQKDGNLLPQMFKDCPDFLISYENT
jgi:hypothetical protein